MSRAAKLAGWIVFIATTIGAGLIGVGLASIRSPLADGSSAAGAEPTAYVVIGVTVLVGAAIAGVFVAGMVEGLVRLFGRRRP